MVKPARDYLLAAILAAATVAIVAPFDRPPLTLLLLPILASAYFGRLGPGLFATAVVTAAAFAFHTTSGIGMVARPIALALVGTVMCFVIDALHRTRMRATSSALEKRSAAQRFETLFHASPVAMSLSRLDDAIVVEINDAYSRLFELDRDELIGRRPRDTTMEVELGKREAMFVKLREQGQLHVEVSIGTRTGNREVMLSARLVELDGVRYAMSTFLDMTAHKHAEDAARLSDERLRELAANIQEVFWLTDVANTKMLYVSPSYERIFGRSCDALYADARDWTLALHPEDRAGIVASTTGSLEHALTESYRLLRPDGTLRRIQIKMFPIRDAAGVVVRAAGVAEDVTDRITLEEQVRQTQKLESLGLLAGGVAHDFNNILAVISANTSMLADSVPADSPDRELVNDIELAVHRATGMTRQLLAFSRKQVVEPIVIDLNAAVTDTRKMLRRMVGETIVITTSLEPDLAHIRIDPNHLVQIVMNLTVNARDAMPSGGTLTLTTRAVQGEVMLSVTDSGCGMPAEVQARVFEPFFTTKGIGKGTGLGLSVVHGIVQQAGGRIVLDSAPDLGTCFRIYLPSVDAPAEPIADVVVAGATGTEKIVVVDDDLFVRTSMSRALRARGYTVLEAGDGQAALRLLGDAGQDIALLVTDVVMPGMDGRELATTARIQRPALKVLYMSGYNDDSVLQLGVRHAEVDMLEKPFRAHVLTGRVRQILDAA